MTGFSKKNLLKTNETLKIIAENLILGRILTYRADLTVFIEPAKGEGSKSEYIKSAYQGMKV